MTVRIAKQLQGFKYDTVKQREVADTNLSSATSKLVCIQKIKSWHLRSDVGYLAKNIGKIFRQKCKLHKRLTVSRGSYPT